MAKKIQVILFDLGNTLLHFDGVWDEIFREMNLTLAHEIKKIYPTIDVDTFTSCFNDLFSTYINDRENGTVEVPMLITLNRAVEISGLPPIPEVTGKNALKMMYAVSEEHWHLPEDTLPVLQQLSSDGYRLGIICNAADHENAQRLIDKTGIRSFFDYVSISAAEGVRKPSRAIFQHALDFFQVAPQQVVMVGDLLGTDILGANGIGLHSVWLTRWSDVNENEGKNNAIQPEASISRLVDLPQLLDKWNSE
jgi:HAD superfamily hydrolase (TIGR01662 family)